MFAVCIVDYVELNLLITEVSHLGCQFVVPKSARFGCREFCLSNSPISLSRVGLLSFISLYLLRFCKILCWKCLGLN